MRAALQLLQFMNYRDLLERSVLADQLGFHSVWLDDHFETFGSSEFPHLEALTLMAALAQHTQKVRLGSLVLCNSFRNPAYLAKALASIDHMSEGRLEVGLGAGWLKSEHLRYGYEFPSTRIRLERLEEAVQILRLMFTERRCSFAGRHYWIDGAVNNPMPAQSPHPPITVGGEGDKVMLRLVARYADRWNLSPVTAGKLGLGQAQVLKQKLPVLKEHCVAIGRDFGRLDISALFPVCIESSGAEVAQNWERALHYPLIAAMAGTVLKGTPTDILAQLHQSIALGVDLGIFLFSDFGTPKTLELFAGDVMPALTVH